MLVDVGGAARIGVNVPSVDPGQQREAYEAFFADAEHRSGWEIERVYATFDVLNSDDQRAACLKLVEDARVDIAMIAGGFNTSQFSCFTHEHAVPVIAAGDSGSPEELYSGRAALFTMMQRSSRQMFNWAAELHSAGDLSRKTVGLVSDRGSDPRGAVVNGQLKASLRQFGYEVAHVTTFSEDMNSAATQVPVEVQQMRQKGVDAVFLATRWPYATQFVQAAASQGWRPAWFASDFAGMSSDEANQNMGQSYEGATSVVTTRNSEWRGGEPEPPPDAACRELYERTTSKRLPRNNGDSNNGSYVLTIRTCGMAQILTAALSRMTGGVTAAGLASAIQQLGPISLPGFGGGSFAPNKFDAADLVRVNEWFFDCRCWRPKGPFHRGAA